MIVKISQKSMLFSGIFIRNEINCNFPCDVKLLLLSINTAFTGKSFICYRKNLFCGSCLLIT